MPRRKNVIRWLGGRHDDGLLLSSLLLLPSLGNYFVPRRSVRIIEDEIYVPGSRDRKHQLDLYLPTVQARPWPVVVFIHGGFWRPMDRRLLQPLTGLHGCVGVALANRGVATAVVGYRQAKKSVTIIDALDDVTRAVRHVVDHIGREGGDAQRLFIVGHSAGGFLATLLALEPAYLARVGLSPAQVRGFGSLAGVYDLRRTVAGLGRRLAKKVRRSAGGREGLQRYSPERLLHAEHPPLLIVMGQDETPDSIAEYRGMAAALHLCGGDASCVEVPGADHMDLVQDLSKTDNRTLSELLRFIERHC